MTTFTCVQIIQCAQNEQRYKHIERSSTPKLRARRKKLPGAKIDNSVAVSRIMLVVEISSNSNRRFQISFGTTYASPTSLFSIASIVFLQLPLNGFQVILLFSCSAHIRGEYIT